MRQTRKSHPAATLLAMTERPDLDELLRGAAHGLRRRWAGVLQPWSLSPHHVRALRVIAMSDGLRPGGLAEKLRVAARSVTDVIDALEEDGLVSRVPDRRDRRATMLLVTDEGRRTLAEIDAAKHTDATEFFAPLTEREQDQLARLLAKLGQGHPREKGHHP